MVAEGTQKPRKFFEPQPVHIEYMTALEKLRHSASPASMQQGAKRRKITSPPPVITAGGSESSRNGKKDGSSRTSTGHEIDRYTVQNLDKTNVSQPDSSQTPISSASGFAFSPATQVSSDDATASPPRMQDQQQQQAKYLAQGNNGYPNCSEAGILTLGGYSSSTGSAAPVAPMPFYAGVSFPQSQARLQYGLVANLERSDISNPWAFQQTGPLKQGQPRGQAGDDSYTGQAHASYGICPSISIEDTTSNAHTDSSHDSAPFGSSDIHDWTSPPFSTDGPVMPKMAASNAAQGFPPQDIVSFGETVERHRLSRPTVPDVSDFSSHGTTAKPCLETTICDEPCGDECENRHCESCDGSPICCEPCDNPELCSSGECEDPQCLEMPVSTCEDHHTHTHTPSYSYPSRTPIASMPAYVNPQQLMLDCQWETSGQQCDASMPLSTLSQHVLQDHIMPQAVLPCQWNECSNPVEIDDIASHVWQYHSPAPKADSYVCLWHGCRTSFSNTDELDQHMKSAHCQMSCHWHGCEQATTGETALKAHVDKHITKAISCSPTDVTPKSTALPTPRSPDIIADAENAPQFGTSQEKRTDLQGPRLRRCELPCGSETTGSPKTCQWILESEQCGQAFTDSNELQAHVEREHLNDSPRTSPSQGSGHVCRWAGCNSETPFSERSKLTRHVFTHTKFAVGSCRFCGKKYNNWNQLTDHERIHTREKPYECETCGFKATNKAALTTHKRTHTGEKPLKCEKCDYTCGDPSNMSKHRKTHDPPVYKCDLCEKMFCRRATLKRHMASHG